MDLLHKTSKYGVTKFPEVFVCTSSAKMYLTMLYCYVATSVAPAPPTSSPPEPRPQPPEGRENNKRGKLLSSIEGFSKGKLKKTVTHDRSAPKL